MIILRTAKNYLKWFGILPIPVQNLPSIFRRFEPTVHLIHTVLFGGSLVLYLSSLGYFLIFIVKSRVTLFMSVFFCSLTTMRVTLYFLMVWGKSELFVLIDDLEDVIKKRKLKAETVIKFKTLSFYLLNHLLFSQEVKIWKLDKFIVKKLRSRKNSPTSFSNPWWFLGWVFLLWRFLNHIIAFTHCIMEPRHSSH